MRTSLIYKLVTVASQLGVKFDGSKDPNILSMQDELRSLGGIIQFSVEESPDGEWIAKSINVDGILTGGYSSDTKEDMLKDAVFTYYGISPKYCARLKFKLTGETKITRQESLVLA